MHEERTIYETVSRFRQTHHIRDFLQIPRVILARKRGFEVLHGLASFALCRPSHVQRADGTELDTLAQLACDRYSQEREYQLRTVQNALDAASLSKRFIFRFHGFCKIDGGFIVGEYCEQRPRLVRFCKGKYSLHLPYDNDEGVRHIHAVQWYEGRLYVTTGDTHKYLDLYTPAGDHYRFERRAMHRLGGYTGVCVAGSSLWFASDFTGRPNYLLNFSSGEKYYFPQPAFTQYCDILLTLKDRYIAALSMDLKDKRTLSIFDTSNRAFIDCRPQRADFYLDRL